MKCSYCGTEYVPGAEKCSGCGAKAIDAIGINIEKKEVINSDLKINNDIVAPPKNTEITQPVVSDKGINNSNGSNYQNNSNKNLKVIIAILIGIIVAMLIFGVWYFIINGDKKSNNAKTEKNTDVVETEPDNVKKSIDNSKKNTVSFLGYKLSVPDGFIYNMYEGNDYIQNDECVILYKSYDIRYNDIINNREKIIEKLKEDGLEVKSFNEKRMYGHNYVVIVAVMKSSDSSVPDFEYGYVFSDLKDEKPALATISSSVIGSFNEKWFDYVGEFFSSAT